MIEVKVAYAQQDEALQKELSLPDGSTIKEALIQSGFIKVFDLEKLNALDVGIYGKKTSISTVLNDGDRVEIYTELMAFGRDLKKKRKQDNVQT